MIVRAHQDLIKQAPVIMRKMHIFTDQTNAHPELLKLNFCGDLTRASWCFRSAFRRFREDAEHSGFLIALPEKQLKQCYYCEGTGKDITDNTCTRCKGFKQIFSCDWKALLPVSASLSIFFRLAESFIAEEKSTSAQSELGGRKMTCDNMDGIVSQLVGLVGLVRVYADKPGRLESEYKRKKAPFRYCEKGSIYF